MVVTTSSPRDYRYSDGVETEQIVLEPTAERIAKAT
jgi:hypothetical protein